MFFNLSDDCMATDQMTINRNGWKSKKREFCHTMKLYNVNIYKEITFICGYYGENDLVNKVLSHVCTHLTLIFVARAQHYSHFQSFCSSFPMFCNLHSSYTFHSDLIYRKTGVLKIWSGLDLRMVHFWNILKSKPDNWLLTTIYHQESCWKRACG